MGEWIIRITISLIMTLSFLVISASSLGEEAVDAKKRRTSINFEDELIEGEVKKPELFYLLQKKQFNFKRLIKLRENFLPEMRRTAEDMPRGGSAD